MAAVEVDHVEVGAVAGGDHATIQQPDGAGGVATVALHEEGERDPVVVPVAPPVGEQGGREAAVADRADVGAAVAQTGDPPGLRLPEEAKSMGQPPRFKPYLGGVFACDRQTDGANGGQGITASVVGPRGR